MAFDTYWDQFQPIQTIAPGENPPGTTPDPVPPPTSGPQSGPWGDGPQPPYNPAEDQYWGPDGRWRGNTGFTGGWRGPSGHTDANGRWIPNPDYGSQGSQGSQGSPTTSQGRSGAGDGGFGQEWLGSGGRTVADLKAFVDRWNAAHPDMPATLGGSKFDKVTIGGRTYDAVMSAGMGGLGASWNDITDGGGSGGAGGGPGYGDYTAPFNERYNLPTLEELQHMPGYQAGLQAYQNGIQTSAASKGTLLTGGTLQRLGQAGTDYANQAYAQLAGLKANEFGINRDIFYHNQDAPFDKYYSLAQLGRP